MSQWILSYEGFEPRQEGLRETLCTLGNGYFATRGAAPESAADEVHYPGTYLAGGYNRLTTRIGDRVVENEDLVNVPNWLSLSFRLSDGDWFDLRRVELLACQQALDLRAGVLTRHVRFRDAQGRRTTLTQRRFVHMAHPHLAGLETTWVAENWSGTIEILSALDGRLVNRGVPRYRHLNGKHLVPLETAGFGNDVIFLKVQTSQSELRIAEAARMRLFASDQPVATSARIAQEPGWIAQHFKLDITEGQTVRAEKTVALFSSRDRAISECGLAAREALADAPGFPALLQSHTLAWQRLWDRFTMELEFASPTATPQHTHLILRLHIFHLLQTTSPHTIDLDVGVPSRGWHGEAYRGHIWEAYRGRYGPAMRLDRILEAEGNTPNRYKASKQADVLMLFYLFSAEELEQLFERLGYPFDRQLIPKTVDYYLRRTSNGSTLSEVVNSWVLARSDRACSWRLFTEALQSDFADVQAGTTPEGIHLGAMAGTVDLIQRCYVGLEARQEVLWLRVCARINSGFAGGDWARWRGARREHTRSGL